MRNFSKNSVENIFCLEILEEFFKEQIKTAVHFNLNNFDTNLKNNFTYYLLNAFSK